MAFEIEGRRLCVRFFNSLQVATMFVNDFNCSLCVCERLDFPRGFSTLLHSVGR